MTPSQTYSFLGIDKLNNSINYCGFMSKLTQNRSSRRHFPKPSSWLGMEKTKPLHNKRMHSLIKRNVLQHKINRETEARLSHLLRHPAGKRSGSILKGKDKRWHEVSKEKKWRKKDKWGSIQYEQANNIYSTKIKNRMKGTLGNRAHTGLLSQKMSHSICGYVWYLKLGTAWQQMHLFPY